LCQEPIWTEAQEVLKLLHRFQKERELEYRKGLYAPNFMGFTTLEARQPYERMHAVLSQLDTLMHKYFYHLAAIRGKPEFQIGQLDDEQTQLTFYFKSNEATWSKQFGQVMDEHFCSKIIDPDEERTTYNIREKVDAKGALRLHNNLQSIVQTFQNLFEMEYGRKTRHRIRTLNEHIKKLQLEGRELECFFSSDPSGGVLDLVVY